MTKNSQLEDTLIVDCSVSGIEASAYGGGFIIGYTYNEKDEGFSEVRNVTVSNCVARSTSAAYGGGASLNRVNVDGLVVAECKALNSQETPSKGIGMGGGMFKLVYVDSVLKNMFITNCTANLRGGGFSSYGGTTGVLHVADSSFVCNFLDPKPDTLDSGRGAGADFTYATNYIDRSLFCGNRILSTSKATIGARLDFSASSGAFVSDSVICGNVTEGGSDYGGGLLFSSTAGPLVVSNCVLEANSTRQGGGFYVSSSKDVILTDVFCVSNNAYDRSIGYISLNAGGCSAQIRNSYFTGNGGEGRQWFGSLLVSSTSKKSPVMLEYCTFVSNCVDSTVSYVVGPSINNPAKLPEKESETNTVENFQIKGCVFTSNSDKSTFPLCMNAFTNITYTYADSFRATWMTSVEELHNYNKSMLGNQVPVVDLASDHRLRRGTSLVDGGVAEDWMGVGKRNGQLDMGDGTYSIVRSGEHGVTVVRHEAVPRIRGRTVDYGCFEYNFIPGMYMLFK